MIPSQSLSRLAVPGSVLLAAMASAQMDDANIRTAGARGRFRGSAVKARIVPFPALSKSLAFAPLIPQKTNFIEMGAFVADLPVALVPGLKKPVAAVQLVYGFKGGGIACVYEMPRQAGMDPLKTFRGLIDSRTFRERQYFKGWTIRAVPDAKLALVVSGTDPNALGAMLRALGKK